MAHLHPFASALQTLRSANQERRDRRLTPPAPAPRDSDATIGDPEPEHASAELPPTSTRWAAGDEGRTGG